MVTSYIRTNINEFVERSSILTLSLFILVILYILLFLPATYLTADYTTLSLTSAATLLTPIGTVLTSVLLAALYYNMVTVQSTQVEIMDRQAGWAEAANSPAIIIDRWFPKENDNVVFYLHNKGNSHVEEMRLIVKLKITDTITGDTVEEYESRSTLTKREVDGYKSRFLPANTLNYVTFHTGVAFERETPGGSARFSTPVSLLNDLTEDRDTVLPCEFTLTLESVAPGGSVNEREFYRFSTGVFEERELIDLIKEGKWESRSLHVQPE